MAGRAAALAWALAVGAACGVLAGCGPSPAPSSLPGSGPAAEAGAAEILFRRGNGPEPDTLDPQRAEDESSRNIIRDLFEGLVAESRTGEFEPGAAASWIVSADGLAWTFALQPDGRWSNGDPVTAADFVAGLRRAVDPATASSSAALLAPLAGAAEIVAGRLPPEALGAEAEDAYRLVLRLNAPTPWLLGLLTHPITFPVHGPSLAEHGARYARPGRLVSNGPYMLDAWEAHSHVQLVRNPHFRAPPPIGRVRFYAFEAPEAALNRYRAGDLDQTQQVPMARFGWLREHLPEDLRLAPSLSTQFWLFNTARPPLDDLRVRQALAMTVDRELLTNVVTGLGDAPAYGLVPPGVAGYTAQSFAWRDWPVEQRLARARELLAEAGYGPDRPLRVDVHYNTDENLRRVAVAVTSMWREQLGVQSTLHNEEFRVLLSRRRNPDQWQVLRLSWAGDYNDAANFLEILSVHGTVNDTGFNDPEYERLLAAAATELDPARRRQLLEEAERRMLALHPILPLYHPVSKHLVKPWVRGFNASVLNRVYTRHLDVDIEKRGF